ncbi:hypothetical protein SBRCBS47491_007267 [Sporothrix bragantina]|uniref:Peptidase S9 prolyl oligopeptidase catalytic domain-containing protein n=1 Tax=Sporothrix bragantina TaxID=671064 RepID=A0ABP0CBT0_9PEZI
MASLPFTKAVYKTVDGHDIDARVYVPSTILHPRCPVLINVHGGAFMLGAAGMVNADQVQDCLDRGWIVVVPNHRLCPQVNLLEGPMQDCRDLLSWIQDGKLEDHIARHDGGPYLVDVEYIFAFGTSSGGHLALSLGYGVQRPVAGIYDMYGVCSFADAAWADKLPHIQALLPESLSQDIVDQVYNESPVPVEGGVSLEGQAKPGPPDFSVPRVAFAFTQIGGGTVVDAIWPPSERGPEGNDFKAVDPLLNVTSTFPPTIIVHGANDRMVPLRFSQQLYAELQKNNVKSQLVEVPGEDHTFAAKMAVGSATWNLQRQGFDFLEALLPRDDM